MALLTNLLNFDVFHTMLFLVVTLIDSQTSMAFFREVNHPNRLLFISRLLLLLPAKWFSSVTESFLLLLPATSQGMDAEKKILFSVNFEGFGQHTTSYKL